MSTHRNAKLGLAGSRTGRPARARARDRGGSFAGDRAPLVAPLGGGERGGAADARVPARSLESAAPLAAPACVRARGGDLRLPLPDRLGAEVDRGPDRVRALEGLEGAPPSRHLATGGGRQGAGQPGRPQLD